MNFKFKKGDEVCITYGSAFGSAAAYMTAMIEGSTITACKETPEGNVYRLKHFVGWWAEENLVFKSQPAKNSHSHDETSGPDTNTLKVENASESENKAFWKESCMPGEYMCSNCSCFAMHKSDGTESPTKFCPHCGELMTNWEDFV
jgi:hypothetical protein